MRKSTFRKSFILSLFSPFVFLLFFFFCPYSCVLLLWSFFLVSCSFRRGVYFSGCVCALGATFYFIFGGWFFGLDWFKFRSGGFCCVRFESIQIGSNRFGSIRLGSVRFGSVRFSWNRFGSIRRLGSIWFSSKQFRSVRLESVEFGSVRFGSIRLGSVRRSSVRFLFSSSRLGPVRFYARLAGFCDSFVTEVAFVYAGDDSGVGYL